MVCSEKLRRWSSSSIVLRRWVTGTPPVTHTYTQAIKQPTLHYLTRSVRRRAATSKRRNRQSGIQRKIRMESTTDGSRIPRLAEFARIRTNSFGLITPKAGRSIRLSQSKVGWWTRPGSNRRPPVQTKKLQKQTKEGFPVQSFP